MYICICKAVTDTAIRRAVEGLLARSDTEGAIAKIKKFHAQDGHDHDDHGHSHDGK